MRSKKKNIVYVGIKTKEDLVVEGETNNACSFRGF